MTCPHCNTVSSRFSDVCTDCGVSFRSTSSQEATQLSLPFAPLPPELPVERELSPVEPVWVPSVKAEPFAFPTPPLSDLRRQTHRSSFQWSIPSLLFVLAVSALAGRGIHQMVVSRGATPRTATTVEPSAGVAVSEIIAPSETSDNTSEVETEEPLQEDVLATPAFLASLKPTDESYLPFVSDNRSSPPLKLRNSTRVPERVRAQIMQCYRKWKVRHRDSIDQVERFMNLYAPEAQIVLAPGKALSRGELHDFVIEAREAGYLTSAMDQKTLEWAQTPDGDRVELLAYHLYGDDSGNKIWGQRRLVWEKSGPQWLIVHDDFPPRYISIETEQVPLTSQALVSTSTIPQNQTHRHGF